MSKFVFFFGRLAWSDYCQKEQLKPRKMSEFALFGLIWPFRHFWLDVHPDLDFRSLSLFKKKEMPSSLFNRLQGFNSIHSFKRSVFPFFPSFQLQNHVQLIIITFYWSRRQQSKQNVFLSSRWKKKHQQRFVSQLK